MHPSLHLSLTSVPHKLRLPSRGMWETRKEEEEEKGREEGTGEGGSRVRDKPWQSLPRQSNPCTSMRRTWRGASYLLVKAVVGDALARERSEGDVRSDVSNQDTHTAPIHASTFARRGRGGGRR